MILNISDFPNLLDKINLTSVKISSQVSSYELYFDKFRNKKVEWEMQLPMFVNTFYDFVISNNKIPTQNEMWESYLNELSLPESNNYNEVIRGIKARLLRAYPSLVRDLHFCKYLEEKAKNGARVIYNIQLDTEHGIDLLIYFKSRFYAINLFTNTKRAYEGRSKKAFRHEPFDNVKYIDLPITFKKRNQNGDFFLFGNEQLDKLREHF